MKTLLLLIALSICISGFSQAWVTNLQMKVSTWRSIGTPFKSIEDSSTFVSFNKVFNSLKPRPADASNLTLDSIPTSSVVILYDFLLNNIGYDAARSDFVTSIQSKRNTNALLDDECDKLELRMSTIESSNTKRNSAAYGYRPNQ